MQDCSLAQFLSRLAQERDVRLTNVQSLDALVEGNLPLSADLTGDLTQIKNKVTTLVSNLSTVNSAVNSIKATVNEINADLVTTENLDEVRSGVKNDSESLFEQYVTNKLQLQVSQLNTAVANINTALEEAMSALQEQVEGVNTNINGSIDSLSEATDSLATTIDTVKRDLAAAVNDTKTSLNGVILEEQGKLEGILENLREGVLSSVSTTEAAIKQSLSSVNQELNTVIQTMKDAIANSIDSTEDTLSEMLRSVDDECNSIVARINNLVSEFEGSNTIKDIQMKVSSFYDVYGELVSKLSLLQSQCVVTYKEWVQQAQVAASQELEVADALESIDSRIKGLSDHEASLAYLTSQFDKLNLIASTINTLNSHWEQDHATIEKFNEIIEKQQIYDKSLVAANVGVLLTGISDAANAAKKPAAPKVY